MIIMIGRIISNSKIIIKQFRKKNDCGTRERVVFYIEYIIVIICF